jgi:hypothetical protein
MVSLCWGVCKASRWRHRATVPAHRQACARNTVTLQLQDGGYALLWKRYNNNNMAAIPYYGNVMTSTKWRLCVAMKTLWQQQNNKYGRYAILWKRYNRCILHLQQYSRRLNFFFVDLFIFSICGSFRNSSALLWIYGLADSNFGGK